MLLNRLKIISSVWEKARDTYGIYLIKNWYKLMR